MKVLLFVQTGDERPKVSPTTAIQRSTLLTGKPGGPGSALPTLVHVRWWLVECENAEAGRATIEHVTLDDNSQCPINCPCCGGRILASGGRHA